MIFTPTLIPFPSEFKNEQDLADFWTKRGTDLENFINQFPARTGFLIDLKQNLYLWHDDQNNTLITAYCRGMFAYSTTTHSILMDWANTSLPEGASVDKIASIPDELTDTTEDDALWLAMKVATVSQADFIIQSNENDLFTFFALNNVQSTDIAATEKETNLIRLIQELDTCIEAIKNDTRPIETTITACRAQAHRWEEQINIYNEMAANTSEDNQIFIQQLTMASVALYAAADQLAEHRSREWVILFLSTTREALTEDSWE